MNEVGIGTRVLNFLVDTILIFLLAFGLHRWWLFYVRFWEFRFIPFYLFFHFSIFLYYTFFEMIWSRTPGKWLSMTKVRNKGGGKPALYQVIIRSLVRLCIVYFITIPFIGRPLHDAASGTRVVEV